MNSRSRKGGPSEGRAKVRGVLQAAQACLGSSDEHPVLAHPRITSQREAWRTPRPLAWSVINLWCGYRTTASGTGREAEADLSTFMPLN